GASISHLFRHREEITVMGQSQSGDVDVVFDVPYQHAPAITLRGHSCVCYSDSLPAGRQKLILRAVNVSAAGFTSRAQIRSSGAMTEHTNDFQSGAISTVGATRELTLNPGAASDDRYTVQYAVIVSAN